MSLEEKMVSACETYVSSLGAKNLDAIMDLYTDDAWIEDPVGTEKRVGRDALREFYQNAIDMGAIGTLESEVRVAGNMAAFAFKLEVDLGDSKLVVRPIDVMTFNDDGKITSMRAIWGPRNQSM